MTKATPPIQAQRVLAIDVSPAFNKVIQEKTGVTSILVHYGMLSLSLLSNVMPDLVVAPLLGSGFDILDVADKLASFKFAGRLVAMTAPLPNPEAVRAEVQAHVPKIPFDLVIVTEQDLPTP